MGIVFMVIGLFICGLCTVVRYFSDDLVTSYDTIEDMGFIAGHLIIAAIALVVCGMAFNMDDGFATAMIQIAFFAVVAIIALIKPVKAFVELVSYNGLVFGVMAYISFVMVGLIVIAVGVIWVISMIIPAFIWIFILILDQID